MSIQLALEEAKGAGRLAPFAPRPSWAETPRAFLMSTHVRETLTAGRLCTDVRQVARWAALEADISHFVEGGLVTGKLMKRLTPPKYERWELRSTRPRPSLRVLGRFALPDVFIATHVVERTRLGGRGTLEWELTMLKCEEIWRDCLGDVPPYAGSRYEDYITENARFDLRIEA